MVALLPMSIGKSATINEPANVRPDKTATVSLLPVALLPVILAELTREIRV